VSLSAHSFMPIKFRCPHCRQFLGIARTKAGEIADCPMCGKTLRVPDLDGTVRPLPKPELNLEDQELVEALGELAGIGTQDASGRTEAPQRRGDARSPAPVPAPQPVELKPLEPAVPVVVAEPPRPARPQQFPEKAAAGEPQARAGQLLAEPKPVSPRTSRVAQPQRLSRAREANRRMPTAVWMAVGAVAAVVVLGGVAVVLMNRAVPSPTAAGDDAVPSEAAASAQAARLESSGEPAAALTGRITYVSEAGDTRPDDGARVIVLPAQRRGTIKFDAAGFMAGSGDVDAAVATAAMRALGGDLAIADEKGEYAVTLPQAGSYQLVVISRHQSRSWQVGVEASTQEMLERFFIRPSTLLGQLAYTVQPFQYRGQGTSPRDFAFERQ
jgi:hypothetical protein